MSESATWDTLQIARDARLCGEEAAYMSLLAEVAPDFEVCRCTSRRSAKSIAPRIYPGEFARHQVSGHVAYARTVDWLAWREAVIVRHVGYDPDTIEVRVARYAQIIMPQWSGVFMAGVD